MEADFLRCYGLDLRDCEAMPLRRLVALVRGLPGDAAVWANVRAEQQVQASGPRKVSLSELGSFFAGHGAYDTKH